MKKKFRILIAVLTITALFFSMSAFAYADMQAPVTPTVEKSGYEAPVTMSYSYDQNAVLESSSRGLVIPITVSKAGVIQTEINVTRLDKSLVGEVFTDEACTNRISGYYVYLTAGETTDTSYAKVSNAGTYYLKISSSTYDDAAFVNSFDLSVCQWTSGDITVTSGKKVRLYNYYPKDYRDFKFKATKTGKITVSHNSNYGFHAQILSSKKKVLSEKQWCSKGVNREKCQFAVKKGVTYYVRIYPNDSGSVYHEVTVKQTAISEKSGAKKSKAVLLKAKAKAKGTIIPGSSQADWYKLKLTKKKTLTVTLDGEASTDLNLTVYTSAGKKIGTQTLYGKNTLVATVTNSTTYGKANKGTYYIKISRKGTKDSGIYTLSWK